MAIRLSSYLKRNRFGIYYFRRVIPLSLRDRFVKREIYRSLRTSNRHNATVQSQVFGLVTDLFFQKLNVMPKNKNEELTQVDIVLELALDGVGTIKLDVAPDEIDAGKSLISHAVDRLSPFLGKVDAAKPTPSGKLLLQPKLAPDRGSWASWIALIDWMARERFSWERQVFIVLGL